MKARIYFESHITVDAGEDWDHFVTTVPSVFRCSRFDDDLVDNYNGKWFCSSRSDDYFVITNHIRNTLDILKEAGYNVIRWKIEDTLLDSKYGSVL